MKKVSTVAAKSSKKISQQKLTVGLDLGDRNSWYCVLDESGQIQGERAASVRDYLTEQGIPISSVVIQGFGKTQPVASNATAAGRRQNRRVELVVSGEVIGTKIGSDADTTSLHPNREQLFIGSCFDSSLRSLACA
jgi:hypothetical protein